ncbi:hypothetical protein GCM10007199_30920 [Fictibacillus barbaricus]|nr:hypothetical protein GCM10007199_30920 [Fictibacillus barbaricus]
MTIEAAGELSYNVNDCIKRKLGESGYERQMEKDTDNMYDHVRFYVYK